MIIKLIERWVALLDNFLKKIYSEICVIFSAIKSKLPKPNPKPIKPVVVSAEYNQPKTIKELTNYVDEIHRDIREIEKSYDNSSQPLTATITHNQPISGTFFKPTVVSAGISIEDYLKIKYKKPGNYCKRANRILGEDEEPKPRKPRKTRKPKFPDGRSITA